MGSRWMINRRFDCPLVRSIVVSKVCTAAFITGTSVPGPERPHIQTSAWMVGHQKCLLTLSNVRVLPRCPAKVPLSVPTESPGGHAIRGTRGRRLDLLSHLNVIQEGPPYWCRYTGHRENSLRGWVCLIAGELAGEGIVSTRDRQGMCVEPPPANISTTSRQI